MGVGPHSRGFQDLVIQLSSLLFRHTWLVDRAPSDEVLSVMHWLTYEGFGHSVSESVIRKFMVVPDLPAVLGALSEEGFLAREGDRLHLTESGLRKAEELFPDLPPDR